MLASLMVSSGPTGVRPTRRINSAASSFSPRYENVPGS